MLFLFYLRIDARLARAVRARRTSWSPPARTSSSASSQTRVQVCAVTQTQQAGASTSSRAAEPRKIISTAAARVTRTPHRGRLSTLEEMFPHCEMLGMGSRCATRCASRTGTSATPTTAPPRRATTPYTAVAGRAMQSPHRQARWKTALPCRRTTAQTNAKAMVSSMPWPVVASATPHSNTHAERLPSPTRSVRPLD